MNDLLLDLDDFDIEFKVGDVVTATDKSIKNGYGGEKNPIIDKHYIITKIEVYSWHTDIYLDNDPIPFNSVKLVKVNK